jgi:hypothetical protein
VIRIDLEVWTMTEFLSGFLGPEEQLAADLRQQAPESTVPPEVSQAILYALSTYGPLRLAELLPKVHARDRVIITALDELETKNLVQVIERDSDEIAEITADGRAFLNSPQA